MSIIDILGESAVRSLALALAVAVVLRVLRVQHARVAKRAWTAVLILALAMPALVALHIPSFSFTALWSTPQTIVLSSRSVPPVGVLSDDAVKGTRAPVQAPAQPDDFLPPAVAPSIPVPAALEGEPAPVGGTNSHASSHLAWWQIGFAAYLTITTLLLLRVLLGLALAARLWRRAQPFATSEADLPQRLAVRPSVRISMDLHSPATVGHGILLPLEALEWDDAALRATLAHEAQHIHEGDFYLQLAATVHHCFFWISPHAWWLRPQLSRLSETICDRAAIACSGDGLSYAQLLIRFATAEQTPAGMLAMAQSAGLRERIDRLIADPELTGAFRHRRGQAIVAAALLAAAAIVAAASVHIVQPQTVVLAAPQAPAPPAASQAQGPQAPAAPAPAPATPDAVPAPEAAPAPVPPPDVTSIPVPPLPPDAAVEQSGGIAVRLDPEVPGPIISVHPDIDGMQMRVMAMPQIKLVSPGMPNSRGYAIYGPDDDHTVMMHSWFGDTDVLHDEHAKHPAGAILFERDGKTWVIDDPALVKQAQQAYAHVNELAKKQGELGAQQGKLGAKQGDLGALQGQLGAKQGEWGAQQKFDFHFEMPKDFDKTVQDFVDAETKMALERDKMNEQQRAAIDAQMKETRERFEKQMEQLRAQQPRLEVQARQMSDQAEQLRRQMEPMVLQMRDLGAKQGELGRLQGEFGRQQGELGREQHRATREADSKVQSLIDQAVKDGKAHPVQ
ncbi:MAG TPA: M56 family metallopeptidase [Acidobacteriaceae bacterium]|jgi:beta-lactamase regulating signal transducer with metallopeptidase domain